MQSTLRPHRFRRAQRSQQQARAFALLAQVAAATDSASAVKIAGAGIDECLGVTRTVVMLRDLQLTERASSHTLSGQPTVSLLRSDEAEMLIAQLGSASQPPITRYPAHEHPDSDSNQDSNIAPAQELVAAAIYVEQDVVGIFSVERKQPRRWRRDELALLEAIALQIGNVLHRERLVVAIERGADELRTLYNTATAISSQLDLSTTLQNIVEQAARLARADCGWLYLYDDVHSELEIVTTYRCERDYRGERLKLGEGLAGQAAISWQTEHVDDYGSWAGCTGRFGPLPFHAMFAVPLIHEGRLLGVLALAHRRPDKTFTHSDVAVVQLFTAQVVVAVTNARLYEFANQHARRMEALARASQLLDAQGDVAASLQPVAQEAMHVMRAQACIVSLATQDKGAPLYCVGMTPVQEASIRASGAFHCYGHLVSPSRMAQASDDAVGTHENNAAALAAGFASIVSLPLESNGEALGCVTFLYEQPYKWTKGDVEIGRVVINQMSAVLTNAQLYHDAHEAIRLKSEFVATVSHELRTPMGAIMGYAELLMSGSYGPIPEPMLDPMNRLKANASHLLTLINQMLDLSRIEAGRLQIHTEPFSPKDLLKAVTAAAQDEAQTKSLVFLSSIGQDVPSILLGDVARLRQLLSNLVGNSIKFTQKGSIALMCNANYASPVPEIVFQVSDTGAGIAAEQLALIWQPFRQGDGSATRSHNGTGLGLAIAQKLTALMNGGITVDSTVGVGSTFTIRLPMVIPSYQTT